MKNKNIEKETKQKSKKIKQYKKIGKKVKNKIHWKKWKYEKIGKK